jgi:hypothetical protein
MDPARDIHPNLRAHCYAPGKPGPGPGWQKRRRLQAEQIEADLAAALPNRPTALQRLLIERVAALTVEVRSLRARGKTGPEVISLDRAILVGVRQLGIGGALSGYSIQAQNARRSAARTGGNTDALAYRARRADRGRLSDAKASTVQSQRRHGRNFQHAETISCWPRHVR